MDSIDEKAQRIAAFDKIKADEALYTALWHEISAALRSVREEERARCAGIARQEFAETPGYSGAGDIIARTIEADPNLRHYVA